MKMKLYFLLSLLLVLFLQGKWSVATNNSHGVEDQVQHLSHLLQGQNVTVRLSSDGKSRREDMEFNREKWVNYSKKSSSGAKGGRSGGAGSQSIRQPRPARSSSPSIQRSCLFSFANWLSLPPALPCLILSTSAWLALNNYPGL